MHLHPHPLTGSHIRLELPTPAHEAELRAALDCDPENWAIQIASAQGEHTAAWWEALVRGQENRTPGMGRIAFAVRVLASGALAGTSSFLFIDPRHRTLEIGRSRQGSDDQRSLEGGGGRRGSGRSAAEPR